MRRSAVTTLLLVLGIVVIVGVALGIDAGRTGSGDRFVGTDSAATARIEQDHPDYRPWFRPVFGSSSPEVESGLFALQAALGGTVLGYAVGVLRSRRRPQAAVTRLAPAEPTEG